MTRTRSGKTLTELLTMVVVLLGLSGMLAYSVQKVCAVGFVPGRAEPGGAEVSVNLKGQHALRPLDPRAEFLARPRSGLSPRRCRRARSSPAGAPFSSP